MKRKIFCNTCYKPLSKEELSIYSLQWQYSGDMYCFTHKTYKDRKAQIRQGAIDWQTTWENKQYSYGELAYFGDHFYKLGKRYGLLKEFRENAII